jgi:glycosyltransferase involved in cell wall biosynthesis
MRVGLIVSANKWTGAGAVAELNSRALRAAGADAKLIYIGGRNLERRLGGAPWARPTLVKERTPRQFLANVRAVRALAADVDVVTCHLPHDHLLCVAAGVHRQVPLVRAFRNPRHVRRDPYHRWLGRHLTAALPAFQSLDERVRAAHGGLPTAVLPVPVDDRFVAVDGTATRTGLGVPGDAPTIGMVGKLALGRGFELLLEVAARCGAATHVIVVGHGEQRGRLEARASRLGITERVHWTGHQNATLPELFAATNVVLFLAPGSDWGHRAISEAQACARPVMAVPTPGVEDLVEDGVTGRIVEGEPTALADAVTSLIADADAVRSLGRAAAAAVTDRRLGPVGDRMAGFFDAVVSARRPAHRLHGTLDSPNSVD